MKGLNRRNTKLLEEIRCVREENKSLKEKLACFERSRAAKRSSNVEMGTASKNVGHKLDRSILLSHVPQSLSSKSSKGLAHDFAMLASYLLSLTLSVHRYLSTVWEGLGKASPRLVKVVLSSSKFQRLAVRRAPRLRFSSTQRPSIYVLH